MALLTAEKISQEELVAVQALHAEFQAAEARLQGAMRMLAAMHKLPDGSQIDPQTGAIKRPEQKAEAS